MAARRFYERAGLPFLTGLNGQQLYLCLCCFIDARAWDLHADRVGIARDLGNAFEIRIGREHF